MTALSIYLMVVGTAFGLVLLYLLGLAIILLKRLIAEMAAIEGSLARINGTLVNLPNSYYVKEASGSLSSIASRLYDITRKMH